MKFEHRRFQQGASPELEALADVTVARNLAKNPDRLSTARS